MAVHVPRFATAKRRWLLAVAAAGAMVALLPASAAQAGVIKSNSYRYADCTVSTVLDRPYANTASVRAGTNVYCTQRHAWTVGRAYVQYYTLNGWQTDSSGSRSTIFYNSYGMGDRWLYTANSNAGCSYVRSYATASIAGVGDVWVASPYALVCAGA